MSDGRRRDEELASQELAAFTDALLEGEDALKKRERPPLAETVELLARALEPQEPPERLRRRVLRRVRAEWGKGHGTPRERSLARRLLASLSSLGSSRRRRVWAAAAALLVAAVVVTLLMPEEIGGTTGTAGGGEGVIVLAIGLVLAGGLAVAWWIVKRET